MQVSTPTAQLGVGSQLVVCYREATSIPYGHLLIDLTPRTDGILRFCTNTGSIPSKVYNLNAWSSKSLWTMRTQNLPFVQTFQLFAHNCWSHFLHCCPNEFFSSSVRLHNKSAQSKPAEHKKTSRRKISLQSVNIVSKTNNLDGKKRRSGTRKRLKAQQEHYSSRH